MNLWEQQLEQDLDWRWAELAALKTQTIIHSKGSLAYRSLLRALCAMLYAHYEGFCLFALGVYLEQLESSQAHRQDYKESLVIFSLEREFRVLRSSSNSSDCYRFFRARMNDLLKE